MCPNRQMNKTIEPVNSIPGAGAGAELIPALHPYVRHCGHDYRSPWNISSRKLLDYLLVYIISGRGTFEVGGVTLAAEPGALFWIPPDTPHAMQGDPPSMELAYAHFDLVYRADISHWDFTIPGGTLDLSEFKPLMHEPVDDARMNALCGRLSGYTNERAGHLLIELCAEAVRAQPFGALRMSGLMTEIIAEILRGQAGLSSGYTEHIPILEKAATTLRERCHTKISMKTISRESGLSPSHFRNLFQRHFGCPPRTYLRQARIGKACRLMMGASMTLSQIAIEVGFESVHSFSKAFRAEECISPSEYRHAGQAYTRVTGRQTAYPH